MSNLAVAGSLQQMAAAAGHSLAESFVSCDVIVMVDVSGSMSEPDVQGKTRYAVAVEQLKGLQAHLPGKVAVIGFGSDVNFFPAGVPMHTGGGTAMDKVLKFVKVADAAPGMRFFMISDGQPNDAVGTLKIAKTFKNKIDCIYVGPEYDSAGREFLRQLALATGGQTTTGSVSELTQKIETLLLAG